MKAMKKVMAIFAICTVLAMSLAACKDNAQEKAKYTITFMNGDKTLGTATVEEGANLSEGDYSEFENVEDAQFKGWYETPGFLEISLKDLKTATFTKDTTLYGSFKSSNVAEDSRLWYIVGTSEKGILKTSNWAGSLDDADKVQFQFTSTGNATNEVSVTIDLFAGDQFQVIHDWAWDDQKGFGCVTQVDETQIENGGGLGGSAETSNCNVIMDGNYTLTLTTDPDNPAQDTLIIVRNGDPLTAGGEVESEEPFVTTENTTVSVKGSWVSDWSEYKELTRTEGNTYTISMELTADTELCFCVFEGGEDTGIVLKGSNVTDDASKGLLSDGHNVVVAADGTYNFTVNLDAMTVVITK